MVVEILWVCRGIFSFRPPVCPGFEDVQEIKKNKKNKENKDENKKAGNRTARIFFFTVFLFPAFPFILVYA